MTESLRGQLLVASPALIDPNFRRTVVLVVAHDEDGAVGLVLNRPTDAEVAEAVPELAELVEPGATVSVGGPVQNEAVVVLAEWDDHDEAGAMVFEDIGLMGADADPSAWRRRRAACACSPATRAGAAASSRPSSKRRRGSCEPRGREDVFGERRPLGERPAPQGRRVHARRDDARRPVAQLTGVVQLPDEAQALEREPRIDRLDRLRVRRDQVGEAAGRDDVRLAAELAAGCA